MSGLRHKKNAKAAKGGIAAKVAPNKYNAAGSPEMKEATTKNEGFKHGGKKAAHGGRIEFIKSLTRKDKKPRRPKNAAGGPVFSSASHKTEADKGGAGQGHQSDGPKGEDPDRGYAEGGRWIQGAIKHKGALKRSLHVPEGEKIPEKKLKKAMHSTNQTLRKRAQLAETLKGLRK